MLGSRARCAWAQSWAIDARNREREMHMPLKNWPLVLLGIAAPLGLGALLLLQPYAGLPVSQPVAPLDVAPAAVAAPVPVASAAPALLPPAAAMAPPGMLPAPAELAAVPDSQRAVIAYTGNVIGETDPCG